MADKKKKKDSKEKFDSSKYIDVEPNVDESKEDVNEILTISQRKARGRMMKRLAPRIARKRKIAMNRRASGEKLQARAIKKARNIVKSKLAGGKKYSDLSVSQKMQIDKRAASKTAVINRIAKKELPQVRRDEIERVKKMRSSKKEDYDINEQFELFMEEKKMKDDPCWDGYEMIGKKKKGGKEVPNCVPNESLDEGLKDILNKFLGIDMKKIAKEVENLKKDQLRKIVNMASPKSARRVLSPKEYALWNAAYERLNSSSELTEIQIVPKKRFHNLLKKDGTPLVDRRFKMFKNPRTSRDEYVKDAMKLKEMIENVFGDDPSKREEGTDSLDGIYRDDTPGQKTESRYYNSDIPSEYNQIEKGDRVVFVYHSMDMAEDDTYEKEGTVVGSNVSHLRVRDDDGKLYLVRHNEAIVTEDVETPLFTLDEAFELRFMSEETMMDKIVAKIHKHVSKGKHLDDIVNELLRLTGLDIKAKDIINAYIEKYHNDPRKKQGVSRSRETQLRKKYLGT